MFADARVKSYLEFLALTFPLDVLQSLHSLNGVLNPELPLELKGLIEAWIY